jgi:hypothetical protein
LSLLVEHLAGMTLQILLVAAVQVVIELLLEPLAAAEQPNRH